METTYTETHNLGLSLYGDNDPADLRDGYNRSMGVIDSVVHENSQAIAGNMTKIQTAQTTADTAKTAADTAKTAADTAKTAADTAQTTADTAKTAADTAKTAADAAKTAADTAQDTADNAITATQTLQSINNNRWFASLKILCIGDSFGDEKMNSDSSWTKQLRNITGATVYSQCVSGTGFARPNYDPNFLAQLQNFHTEHPDSTDINMIIIAGGINDPEDFSNNLGTAVKNTLNYARTTWPQARVIVIPMMAGVNPIAMNKRAIADYILNVAKGSGCETVPWAWTWRIGNSSFTKDDNLHPNPDGAKQIAQYIVQSINGNYHGRTTGWIGVQTTDGVFLQARGDGGKITIIVDVTLNVDGDGYNKMSWSIPASSGLMTYIRGAGVIITRNGDFIGGMFTYFEPTSKTLVVSTTQKPIASAAVIGPNAYNGQTFSQMQIDW